MYLLKNKASQQPNETNERNERADELMDGRRDGFAKLMRTKNHYKKFLLTFGGKSFEPKRNETKSKRIRNGTKLGRRVVAEIRGDVWVAVWWPKFWPKSGSPCGGRNFGRKKFSLRTNVTFVN